MDQDSMSAGVVRALRASGIDVLTSSEAGRQRVSDLEQLEFATAEGRVIYTANRQDYARLHSQWMAVGRDHAGIITRSRQGLRVGDQVRGLTKICNAFEPAEFSNLFEYLEAWVEPRS
jgi:uncharacterized protein with PIN domain